MCWTCAKRTPWHRVVHYCAVDIQPEEMCRCYGTVVRKIVIGPYPEAVKFIFSQPVYLWAVLMSVFTLSSCHLFCWRFRTNILFAFRIPSACYVPVWWTGNKNSPTVTHACRKRRLKWVAGAWGCNWATVPLGDINTEAWSFRVGVGRGANNPNL
jgi:hypothetical protein